MNPPVAAVRRPDRDERHDRVDERRDEDPERDLGEPGAHEHPDRPRRVLAGGELDRHEGRGEHDAQEREHPGRDDGRQGRRGTTVADEEPVVGDVEGERVVEGDGRHRGDECGEPEQARDGPQRARRPAAGELADVVPVGPGRGDPSRGRPTGDGSSGPVGIVPSSSVHIVSVRMRATYPGDRVRRECGRRGRGRGRQGRYASAVTVPWSS